jgi:hypothetical protein
MTRAVIELSGDLNPAMPVLARSIEGCAYSPEGHSMGFCFENMGVIVERRRIIINNAEDEAQAWIVMDWLTDRFEIAAGGG